MYLMSDKAKCYRFNRKIYTSISTLFPIFSIKYNENTFEKIILLKED